MDTELPPFKKFAPIPRLFRETFITEKIDGTCSTVYISDWGDVFAGGKDRWLTAHDDNYDFFQWVRGNKAELSKLGPGFHSGEYWGYNINRGYGCRQGERYFSLFNTGRWLDEDVRPACCLCVPLLYQGVFDNVCVDNVKNVLRANGSVAKQGFMRPEGIVLYHTAANQFFKSTMFKDELPKSLSEKT